MESMTITDKDIEKHTTISEKEEKIEKVMKDLEDTLHEGLISQEAYKKARQIVISKAIPSLHEKGEISEKEVKVEENKEEGIEEREIKGKKDVSEKDKKGNEQPSQVKSESKISFVKKKHIEELEKMKRNWINDLESLKRLYEHNIISQEEYERSKEEIEEKIDKVEEIIKKEMEMEEIEELKRRIEREIEESLNKGVFKEEESKLKHDLEALDSLFKRGLISQKEYEEKKKVIEKQLENYDKLVELIDAIFDKFIEDLNKKIEENKEITQEKEPPKEEKEIIKQEIKWYHKILATLGLYTLESDNDSDKALRELIEQIKKAYNESERRFKISNMAMVIKKKVKEILGIDKAITYKELIDKIEESDKFSSDIKAKLRSYFNEVMLKEYLEEENEKDIMNIYKESLELAEILSNESLEGTSLEPKKVKNDASRGTNEEIREKISEENEKDKSQKTEPKKKKSIFDKINDFFGV